MPKKQRLAIIGAILWFIFFAPDTSKGQVAGDSIKADLREDWLIFNNRYKTYAPYIGNTSPSTSSFSFILNKTRATNTNLVFCFQKGSSLFIEQQIVGFFEEGKCMIFDLDSLFGKYQAEELFVTVYNKSLDLGEHTTLLTSKNTDGGRSANLLQGKISPRDGPLFKNFYILALLTFLVLLSAVYNLNPRNFREFYSLSKTFSVKLRYDNASSLKVFNWPNILIVFTHCLVISYMLVVVISLLGEPVPYLKVDMEDLGGAMWRWISLALLVFLLMLGKFVLIKVLSAMMNLKELDQIHFFEFIRISIFIYNVGLIFMVVPLLAFYLPAAGHFIWIVYLVAFLSAVRIVLLYLKFLRLSTFRNLYLFSYLCTTEILPLIIGFKIFVLGF